MFCRLGPSTAPIRHRLDSGWELCSTPAGEVGEPSALHTTLAWVDAIVPGTVASSLRAASAWSLDSSSRRFDAEDWWFRTRFDAPPGLAERRVVLGFDGLATLATVWLNGEQVLSSDNMFLAHEVEVASLRSSGNELLLCFRSLDAALTNRRPRPRWRAPMVEHQQLRWFRTTLLGRTPGWSPPAQCVGPWRKVWVGAADREPAYLDLQTSLVGNQGHISVECSSSPAAERCVLKLSQGMECREFTIPLTAEGRFAAQLLLPEARRWWPHTHGEPALYRGDVVTLDTTGRELHRWNLRSVAFRHAELDTTGDGFQICVNGIQVFCRGACWTPLDPVRMSSDEPAIRGALCQVRDAGMNMLRVSGTMVYESESFYATCDELGILVWQDLMFANMDYPFEDPGFKDSVTRELRQQTSRLLAHPSVVLICGNSEVEQQAAMWGAGREFWSPPLFHEHIPALLKESALDIPYWPSSAHGGAFPHAPNAGTSSYYGVGAYRRPLTDAHLSQVKFASECLAFANVPEPETLAAMTGGTSIQVHHPTWKARSPRDLGAGWDFDDIRDHYVRELFGVDPLTLRYSDPERHLALGRIATAEVMQSAFRAWRSEPSCGGALVWFLRDLWPGAGWGIIGADSIPKSAYHYLRRTLQPVDLWISDEGCNGLLLHVANDHATAFEGRIELTLYRGGEQVVGRRSRDVSVAGRNVARFAATDWFEGFSDLSYAYRFGPPGQGLVTASLQAASLSSPLQAVHAPQGFVSQADAEIGLAVTAEREAGGEIRMKVSTRAFAHAVCIEVDGHECVDQYFHLLPGASRELVLRPRAGRPIKNVRGQVRALNSLATASFLVP